MAKGKIPSTAWKKGQSGNPEGKGFTHLQTFAKRAEHFSNKYKPSEIIAIAADPLRWDDHTHWDIACIKRMAAQIDGRESERAEMAMLLDRKEGKAVERKEVRVIRSLSDLTDDELQAIAASSENAEEE